MVMTDMPEQVTYGGPFKDFAYDRPVRIPLAKESHLVEPSVKEWTVTPLAADR
jgi:hypothetical protein